MHKNHSTAAVADYAGTDAPYLFEQTHPRLADDDPPQNTPPAQMTCSVVTNSCLLREGLVQLLGPHLNMEIVRSYGEQFPDPAQFPTAARHVVLVDGGLGQTAIIRWIKFWRGRVAVGYVFVVELMNDIELILACIEAGAHGYTIQGASSTEIATAINDMLHGRAHCAPEVTARVFARLAAYGRSTSTWNFLKIPLTKREMEVLQYLVRDYSNQDIATQLIIEVRTVKHHVHNILEKLQLHHRWEAARIAVERGWVKDGEQDPNLPT